MSLPHGAKAEDEATAPVGRTGLIGRFVVSVTGTPGVERPVNCRRSISRFFKSKSDSCTFPIASFTIVFVAVSNRLVGLGLARYVKTFVSPAVPTISLATRS